jgi:putative membrane protein
MMWDGNGSWGYGAGGAEWLMFVFMMVFVVAVIVTIVFLVRYLSHATGGAASPAASATGQESPTDILKRRYAAGEIERDEYVQKLGDL